MPPKDLPDAAVSLVKLRMRLKAEIAAKNLDGVGDLAALALDFLEGFTTRSSGGGPDNYAISFWTDHHGWLDKANGTRDFCSGFLDSVRRYGDGSDLVLRCGDFVISDDD